MHNMYILLYHAMRILNNCITIISCNQLCTNMIIDILFLAERKCPPLLFTCHLLEKLVG